MVDIPRLPNVPKTFPELYAYPFEKVNTQTRISPKSFWENAESADNVSFHRAHEHDDLDAPFKRTGAK
jgi:hypothetical protein